MLLRLGYVLLESGLLYYPKARDSKVMSARPPLRLGIVAHGLSKGIGVEGIAE